MWVRMSRANNPDSPNSGPRHRKCHRPMPYVAVLAMACLLVLGDPRFIHPFINPGGPRWLSATTLMIGVTSGWLFARALLIAQIRAMSLGEQLRDDKAVNDLIAVALSRIGLFSFWATLVGLASLSWGSVPDELSIMNTLSAYVTLGALTGFALCVYESLLTYRSSLKLMRARATARSIVFAKIVDSGCMLLVAGAAFKLFDSFWVAIPICLISFADISLFPLTGQRSLPDEQDRSKPHECQDDERMGAAAPE
jgi:hypothetical protein